MDKKRFNDEAGFYFYFLALAGLVAVAVATGICQVNKIRDPEEGSTWTEKHLCVQEAVDIYQGKKAVSPYESTKTYTTDELVERNGCYRVLIDGESKIGEGSIKAAKRIGSYEKRTCISESSS